MMIFMDMNMPHGKPGKRTKAQLAAELLGALGGRSRSDKKVAAARINAVKALAARKALEAKPQ